MSKTPAFQFYPADWRKDPSVQALSYEERGVWFEILCIMHESDQRGKLLLNGKKMPETALSRMLGLDNQVVNQILTKLLDFGCARVEPETGIIYSKRMVEDERIRMIRRNAGKKGGNPRLLNQNSNQNDDNEVNQNPTPSSSSSTSVNNLPNGKSSAGQKPCPHQQIVDLYHSKLPTCPNVRDWNKTRQGYLRARWNENTERQNLEWWDRLFSYVSESDFLTGKTDGRDGKPPFRADLEWIVRPQNFVKIIEGRYNQ